MRRLNKNSINIIINYTILILFIMIFFYNYYLVIEENKKIKETLVFTDKLEKNVDIILKKNPAIGGIIEKSLIELKDLSISNDTKNIIENLPKTDWEINVREKCLKFGLEKYTLRGYDKGYRFPFFRLDEVYVSSEFGPGYITYYDFELKKFITKKRNYHSGMDLVHKRSCMVFPSKDGNVYFVSKKPDKIYGNYVKIYHKDKYTNKSVVTVYCHLNEIKVKEGDYVVRINPEDLSDELTYEEKLQYCIENSTIIGTMGETGRTYGRHLHWEYWEFSHGEWKMVNPVLNSNYSLYYDVKYKVNK